MTFISGTLDACMDHGVEIDEMKPSSDACIHTVLSSFWSLTVKMDNGKVWCTPHAGISFPTIHQT